MAAGILEPRGELLGFRHDLIREALYHDRPAPVRRGLHLDTGRALAGAGAPPEQVAEQLLRGASAGDTQAVAWLRRAARRAAPRAPAVAVDLLERALELAGPVDPARDGLLAERSVSLMWSGRLGDAETVCREALARGHDPGTDGTLRLCLVETLLGRGRIEEALQEADAAIAAAQFRTPVESGSRRSRPRPWPPSASWRRRPRPRRMPGRRPRSWVTSWPPASVWLPWPWSAASTATSPGRWSWPPRPRAWPTGASGCRRIASRSTCSWAAACTTTTGWTRGRPCSSGAGASARSWTPNASYPSTTGPWPRAACGRARGTTPWPSARPAWSWPRSTACACTGSCSATASGRSSPCTATTSPTPGRRWPRLSGSWRRPVPSAGRTGCCGRTPWCWRPAGSPGRRWRPCAGPGTSAPTRGCCQHFPCSDRTWSAWPTPPGSATGPSGRPPRWRRSRPAIPVWRR
jgi:hypothetical protein